MTGPVHRTRTRDIRSRSFGTVADSYDASRPGYPAEAAHWLAGNRPALVVDLGAGSGLLSEPLLAAGHEVLAVEPAERMLARLVGRAPEAVPLRAAAEALPLARRSVDAVVVGQAFHWFDADVAIAEIARVLRPGGGFGLAWNHRDASVPWVARLSALLRADGKLDESTAAELVARVDASGLFTPMEPRAFRLWQPVDRDRLLGLVRSRSYVATLPDADRQRLLDRVGNLYDAAAPLTGELMLPYVCRCYRARLRRLPRPPGPGS